MKDSYLLMDEYLRFLDKGDSPKTSKSILEVGVEAALSGIQFDQEKFIGRGGVFDWSRGPMHNQGENQNIAW